MQSPHNPNLISDWTKQGNLCHNVLSCLLSFLPSWQFDCSSGLMQTTRRESNNRRTSNLCFNKPSQFIPTICICQYPGGNIMKMLLWQTTLKQNHHHQHWACLPPCLTGGRVGFRIRGTTSAALGGWWWCRHHCYIKSVSGDDVFRYNPLFISSISILGTGMVA